MIPLASKSHLWKAHNPTLQVWLQGVLLKVVLDFINKHLIKINQTP